jgi:uncharacterized protein
VGKVIVWIIVVFVILFVLRLISVGKARRAADRRARAPEEKKVTGAMVRCAECGVFLPKADALPSPKGFRCGDPACAQRHGNAG